VTVAAPPWSPRPVRDDGPVDGAVDADVAVIGAGLTGLSTAWHLLERRPGLRVVVLDAGGAAAGASGAGTGLLGPRAGPPVTVARRRYGDRAARAMFAASRDAVAAVRGLVEHTGIDCGMRHPGQVLGARSAAAADLRAQAAAYAELGFAEVEALSGDELDRRVGPGYRFGLAFPDAGTLDPAALTTGLAAAVVARGGRFHPGSRVVHCGGRRGAAVLRLARGTVRAATVVVATNAFTPALRLPVGGVLPLYAHAVATAPLPAGTVAALGGPLAAAVVGVGPLAPYHRLTPDGRLVVGGGRVLFPRGPVGRRPAGARDAALSEATWRRLGEYARDLCQVPAEVVVTHHWGGPIALTADGLPVLGPVRNRPGFWFAGGWCGHGLAMSVWAGSALAGAILDGEPPHPDLPWWRAAAPRLPLGGPAGVVVRPALRVYLGRLARRAETLGAPQGAGAEPGRGRSTARP
jgi:glycine/D-amino acid oxidase-like deaminating enzyme